MSDLTVNCFDPKLPASTFAQSKFPWLCNMDVSTEHSRAGLLQNPTHLPNRDIRIISQVFRHTRHLWRGIKYFPCIPFSYASQVRDSIISTPLEFFISCKHDESYISRKSVKSWVLYNISLNGVCQSPGKFFKNRFYSSYCINLSFFPMREPICVRFSLFLSLCHSFTAYVHVNMYTFIHI